MSKNTVSDLRGLVLATRNNKSAGVKTIDRDGNTSYISYSSLFDQACRLACSMRSSNIFTKSIINIYIEPIDKLITTLWACFISNYIPVVSYGSLQMESDELKIFLESANRYDYIILDSQDAAYICQKHSSLKSKVLDYRSLFGMEYTPNDELFCDNRMDIQDELALCIHSSGSTAIPKLVGHSHSSILNSIRSSSALLSLSHQDISLNWLPLSHPGPLIRCLLRDTLAQANQIHIHPHYILSDPSRWLELVAECRATNTWAPNYAFDLAVKHINRDCFTETSFDSLRFIINTGEPIAASTIRNFYWGLKPFGLRKDVIVTAWGMAETASGVIFHKVLDPESVCNPVCLGFPVADTRIRLSNTSFVDNHMQGQLEIKGPAVMLGYVGEKGENLDVFTNDGWLRTGDVGYIKDEALYLIGREKENIIVNGVNYSCKIIETEIEEHVNVERSFVAITSYLDRVSAKPVRVIFASFTMATKKLIKMETDKIVVVCSRKFAFTPDYIVGISREQFPKTAIGKIKRLKLQELFRLGVYGGSEKYAVALLSDCARYKLANNSKSALDKDVLTLLAIFAGSTGVDAITPDSNIFGFGINSLTLMRFCFQVGKYYSLPISFGNLMHNNSINKIVRFIKSDGIHTVNSCDLVDAEISTVKLSEIQKQFVFLQLLRESSSEYNITKLYVINCRLNVNKLRMAAQEVAQRHEALRSFIIPHGEGFSQKVSGHVQVNLQFFGENTELSRLSDARKVILEYLLQPFDIFLLPLHRIAIAYFGEGSTVLGLSFHHIIADARSVDVYIRELFARYNTSQSESFCEASFAYQLRHFVAAEELALCHTSAAQKKLEFWKKELKGYKFKDHFDVSRDCCSKKTMQTIVSTIADPNIIANLKIFSKRHNSTLYGVCFAVYAYCLMSKFLSKDLCVGSVVSMRDQPDFENIFGCLVNTIFVRFRAGNKVSFWDIFSNLNSKYSDYFIDNKYPFGKLVRDMKIYLKDNRNPIFDFIFSYDHQPARKLPDIDGASVRFIDQEFSVPQFDLLLLVREMNEHLTFHWSFDANLLCHEEVVGLHANFEQVLSEISTIGQGEVPTMELKNRIAVVTGAGKLDSVGAAVAEELAKRGVNIALASHKSSAEAKRVVDKCKQYGAEILFFAGDLSTENKCNEFAELVKDKWNRVDIVVNCVGYTDGEYSANISKTTSSLLQKTFTLNVAVPFMTVKALFEKDMTKPQSIVNISSKAALSGGYGSVAYCTAKGALNSLTLALARMLSPDTRVNAICPGFINSSWWRNRLDKNTEERAKIIEMIKSVQHVSTPTEIAEKVIAIVIDESMNGELVDWVL